MSIKGGAIAFILSLLFSSLIIAQDAGTGTIRGFIYETASGDPVMFANVFLENTTIGTVTDENGFYSISNIKAGSYTLISTAIGYDTASAAVTVRKGEIVNQQLRLGKGIELGMVTLEAAQIAKNTDIQISTIKAAPKDIKRIPTVGGEADLAQYLQILPGVITTGDQGGQLFIRGGAPVHNKVLLDGMTIYNAFHSIGFFSVYETETIRNVEVLTGGFNAEYGGRISAVIDVTTREGNKQRFGGVVSANPFVSKVLLEGPIKKLSPDGSSISYMVTAKKSYLNESSKLLYNYAGENPEGTDKVLPYNFTDAYAKISIVSGLGSKFNFTGFNYMDVVDYSPVATVNWNTYGIGTDFMIIPSQSKAIIKGFLNYSNYDIELQEADDRPRNSSIGGFSLGMNFNYYLENNSELQYGVDINGFKTVFEFFNSRNIRLDQNQNTTEIGGFLVYKKITDKFVIEPSFRVQYYASLNNISPEPRIGMKYKATDKLRFKLASGVYSQNLISTKTDKDVVNLFTGFLSGPDEQLNNIDGQPSGHKLQKAIHIITGVEYDASENLMVSVEPYTKIFTQLIELNRNKQFRTDPNYMIEEGRALGVDLLAKYETRRTYLWATYSLTKVTRNDGDQEYPPHYDRRHNVNLLGSYAFGGDLLWEASARWNFGSGFPFTKTQAFYPMIEFENGVSTDYTTQNGELGIIYDEEVNGGRLPYYHRLDLSLKRKFILSKYSTLEAVASVTNVYNRDNIFYFDRVRYERVDQLPILPSIGFNLSF